MSRRRPHTQGYTRSSNQKRSTKHKTLNTPKKKKRQIYLLVLCVSCLCVRLQPSWRRHKEGKKQEKKGHRDCFHLPPLVLAGIHEHEWRSCDSRRKRIKYAAPSFSPSPAFLLTTSPSPLFTFYLFYSFFISVVLNRRCQSLRLFCCWIRRCCAPPHTPSFCHLVVVVAPARYSSGLYVTA